MRRRLTEIDAELDRADSIRQLQLTQERLDLQAEIDAADATVDLTELEAGFVASARAYGERRGISYEAWRAVGVPSPVLKAAGVTRGRSGS